MKLLLKLAFVALLANATWHLWGVYSAHFKFKDAVQQVAQFGAKKSDDELRGRILELAAQYELPIADDSFTVHRAEHRIVADGAYSRPVELLPGMPYTWSFKWHVDALTMEPIEPLRSPVPK